MRLKSTYVAKDWNLLDDHFVSAERTLAPQMSEASPTSRKLDNADLAIS